MYDQSLDVRFDAIHVLQGMRARHLPGSRRYEQIEHAIDLALNASRVADEYLIRNVLRDAQRILDRIHKNHPTVSLDNDVTDEARLDPAQQYEQLTDHESPERLAVAINIASAILRDVGGGRVAEQVWDGMLNGETVADLAALTGFSTSYIAKVRMALAASAKTHLATEEM